MRAGGRAGSATGTDLPLCADLFAYINGDGAQVSIRRDVAVTMIDRNPHAKRTLVIERVVPASADNGSGGSAQDWLIPQVEVISVVPIVAIDTANAGAYSNVRPLLSVVAHKGTVINVPGLIVINK